MEKKTKLPEDFRYLMWGYEFEKIDPEKMRDRIIVNTLNYGNWKQWKWLARHYGAKKLKMIIQEIPKSEFRNYRALRLISLILGIQKMKYETRGAKIQSKTNLSTS